MTEPNIAFVANLLADPSRAAMCLSLAGGEARPAGELAARAGISAQTASNHLAKLIAGRLLRRLADIAREKGIAAFEAEVLAENKSMLAVFARSGLPMEKHRDGGTVHLTLLLRDERA